MAFQKPKKLPEFADLKVILTQTDESNPLYQTISTLIDRLTQFTGNLDQAGIVSSGGYLLTTPGGGNPPPTIGGGGTTPPPAITNATYITAGFETSRLPLSRQIIAGPGISLDYTVANRLLISVVGGGDEWSVLTNGDEASPELIFADGDVIMLNW